MKGKLGYLLLAMLLVFALFVSACSDTGEEGTPAPDEEPGDEPAGEVTTVRIGMIATEGHPIVESMELFKDLIAERTDGRYDVQLFIGGTLGNELEMKDQVSLGTIEGQNVGSGITVGDVPATQIFNFLYLFDSPAQMNSVYQSDVVQELLGEFESNAGIKILANNFFQGSRHMLSTKPVYEAGDMAGVKIRVPDGLPLWNDQWEALGATTVSLGWSEVYTSLQQGVVDAVEVPANFMYDGELYKQADYIIKTGHVLYANYLIFNDDFLASLSEEDLQIFEDSAVEAGEHCTELVVGNEDNLISLMEADGIEVIEVDREALREIAFSVAENWESEWGEGVFQRILDSIN